MKNKSNLSQKDRIIKGLLIWNQWDYVSSERSALLNQSFPVFSRVWASRSQLAAVQL